MANFCGAKSVDDLVNETVPSNIRLKEDLKLSPSVNEHTFIGNLRKLGLGT